MAGCRASSLKQITMAARFPGFAMATAFSLLVITALACVPAFALVTPTIIQSRVSGGAQDPNFTFNGPATTTAKSTAGPRANWTGGSLTGTGCYYAGQTTPSKWGDWSFNPAAGRGGYYDVYCTWANLPAGNQPAFNPIWTVHNADADVVNSSLPQTSSNGNAWNLLGTGLKYDAGVAKTVRLATNPADNVTGKRTYFDSVAFEPCVPTAPTPTSPADGATSIPPTGVGNEFAWTAGTYNYRYDLYLSTVQADVTSKAAGALAASDLTTTTFDPDSLNLVSGTVYYWMVVAKNVDQSADGPVQSFTSGGFTVSVDPSSWTSLNSVTVSFDASSVMALLNHYEVALDGGAYSEQVSPYAMDVSAAANGIHTVHVKAISDIGDELIKDATIYLDKTGPADFTPTANPSGWTNGTSVSVSFSTGDATSGMSHYELALDGGAYSTQVSPYSLDVTAVSDGTHAVHVKAVDVAGNTTIKDVAIYIDKTAPLAFTPTSTPASWTNASTVQIDWSTTDANSGVDYYSVGVDGGGYATRVSPYTLSTSGLSDGTHTVTVVAVDVAVNPIAENVSIYIDKTAPLLDSFSSPAAWNGGAIAVGYTASDVTSGLKNVKLWFKKGSGGTWTDSGLSSTLATDTFSFAGTTGDDTYYFGFLIEDNATNVAASNTGDGACHTILDHSLVSFTSIVATPHVAKSGTVVTIAFTSSEVLASNPTVTVNGSAATFVSASGQDYTYTYTVQSGDSEGYADIYIQGTDLGDNIGFDDDLTQLLIDKTAPVDFTPTASPASWTNADTISISFSTADSVSGIDHYELAVDGGAYATQTSPYALSTSGLTDGTHTVHVKAIDLAGNELTKDVTIYVDKTAPADFALTATPSDWTNAASVSISFATTDATSGIARYEVALDGGAYATQTSPYALDVSAVADGTHTVHVKAIDTSGNELIKDVTIYIDKGDPLAFTPTASPASWTNASTIAISFSTTDSTSGIDRYEVAVDGGAYTTQTSPYALSTSGLSDGTHTVHVKAIDDAGNELIEDVSIRLDKTAPVDFTPTANPASWTNADTISISFSTADSVSGMDHFELAVDGGAFAAQTSPYALSTTGLADGTHTVHVKAIDLAGNKLTKDITIYVDKTAPADFTLTATPSDWTNAASVSISFATTDVTSGIARYEVALDGGAYAAQTSPYALDVSAVADGTHTVHVKAIDTAGNELIKDVTIYIDKGDPLAFTPTASPASWTNASTIAISFSTTDSTSGIDRYEVAVDGGAYTTQTSPYALSTSGLSDGTHTVHVKAIDDAGNELIEDTTIYVDKTAPADFTPTATPSVWTSAASVSVSFVTTDATSGLAHYELALDGGSYTTQTSPYTLDVSAVADGTHTVHVKAIDIAGNERIKDVTIRLDKTAPLAFTPTSDPVTWCNQPGASTAQISWATTDAASGIEHYEVALMDGPYTTQTSPYTFDAEGLTPGWYTLHVKAFDAAGNVTTGNLMTQVFADITPPEASLTFSDPNPSLGRQFDYVFWKNWMGVTTSARNTYNISWTATDTQSGVDNVYIEYRANSTDAWSLLTSSSAGSGTVDFDVSALPQSDSYQFRIRAVDVAGNPSAVVYDHFGVYDATKLIPTAKIITPPNGTWLRMGMTFKLKAQETMPVFKDPRVAGKAYKDTDRDWWFSGHALTATPKMQEYRRNSSGRPTAFRRTLLASVLRGAPQSVANTNTTQVAQYLGYVIVNTWETSYTIRKGIVDPKDVFQIEMKYSDIVSVGNVRQPDQPNKPGQILPTVRQEPLINTLKHYEFTRFWVK